MACSLLIHLGGIFGIVYLFDNTRQTVESLASRYTVRMIRFQSSSLLEPRQRSSSAELGAAKAPVSAIPDGVGATPALPAAALYGGRDMPRRFELPKLPMHALSAQILIQPDLPPNLAVRPDTRLPELLLWKSHPAIPALPPRKVFVAQRRPHDLARVANLPAPPSLESPNHELRAADASFSAPLTKPIPLLVRTPATVSPIRTIGTVESGPIPQIASSQSVDAREWAMLSIPEIPVPPAGVFPLPAGNQGMGSGGSAGQSIGTGGPRGAAGAISPISSGRNGQASGFGHGGVAADSNNATVLSMAANAGGGQAAGGSVSPGHGLGAAGTGATGLVDAGAIASRKVTTVVLPPDGHFSVLVESSGSEAFAEAEGVLSGKVVYTVYASAGTRKEWIMEYCLPRVVEQNQPLTGKTPLLEAPFPFLMMRPDLTFGPDIDYLIVHGIVSVLGKLDQLTYVIAPEEAVEKEVLLYFLGQWQLRPGTLDGRPVALEVLLIIPREGD